MANPSPYPNPAPNPHPHPHPHSHPIQGGHPAADPSGGGGARCTDQHAHHERRRQGLRRPRTVTLALTLALALAPTLALTLTLGRRAQDDLPGLVAHDHTDDHHRLLIRLISRHRRSIRTQVPQAADHQDPLPAGALTLHCMHTACALHSCTCTASHGRDPPARRTGAVCPSTTRQASTS